MRFPLKIRNAAMTVWMMIVLWCAAAEAGPHVPMQEMPAHSVELGSGGDFMSLQGAGGTGSYLSSETPQHLAGEEPAWAAILPAVASTWHRPADIAGTKHEANAPAPLPGRSQRPRAPPLV